MMLRGILFALVSLCSCLGVAWSSISDFTVLDAASKEVKLSSYDSTQVLLVVNVASQCGFTAQYAGLQSLHDKYSAEGFNVLAFPCNQFGGQEPASDDEIQNFAKSRFSVKFPVFKKIEVNGGNTHPLYSYLKSHATDSVPPAGWNPGLPEKDIQWNFTKFLLINGHVVKRYSFDVTPEQIESDIKMALQNKEL